MIPVTSEDPASELATLRSELSEYSDELARKPFSVVMTKADIRGDDAPEIDAPDAWDTFLISAVTGEGVDGWKESVWRRLQDELEPDETEEVEPWRP
jgi:GTPase involved in cell partitioning and DNA repair